MPCRTALLVAAAFAGTAAAQAPLSDTPVPPNPTYDGRYAFVRLRYTTAPGPTDACTRPEPEEGPGWHHDYPRADRNLIKATVEVTTLDARVDSTLVLSADDPELTKYPIVYLTEPGCWRPSEREVRALRAYLLKGGLLIVDDLTFGMSMMRVGQELMAVAPELVVPTLALARETFEAQIWRVLPGYQLLRIESSDPLFRSLFIVDPRQITRMVPNAPAPEFRGIYEHNDPTKRLLVLATYNKALGEHWRRSEQGFYPIEPTNDAYKLGVNYLLYGMTH